MVCVFLSLCIPSFSLATDKAEGGSTQSQCVVCHTNVKKLIRLGWEIEKIAPKKGKSAEISGEG
jgi:hypothetical protein